MAKAKRPVAPANMVLALAAATGGGKLAVELAPGTAPPVAATVIRDGAVHGVVGTGDRVTMSGVEETGTQAEQTTVETAADDCAEAPCVAASTTYTIVRKKRRSAYFGTPVRGSTHRQCSRQRKSS